MFSNNAQINKNLLTTKAVNPSESQDPNLALKQRINNARNNANKLSFKLLNKRKALPPVEVAVYKNKELEKALRNGRLDTYKVFCLIKLFISCIIIYITKIN